MANNKIIYILLAVFCLATVSFIWCYDAPLSTDYPMHVAVAKAFVDLLGSHGVQPYPYRLDLKISSYEGAQFILAFFIWLFGVSIGAKLALSFYLILFPLAVYFLVGQLNPRSTWSRLIGFPLTLNYFFHWGFWPFLLGMITAIFAIGLTIKFMNKKYSIPINSLMRLGTLLLHPVPLLVIGLFDVITTFLQLQTNKKWHNPLTWNWRSMLLIWSPSLAFVILMQVLTIAGTGESMLWGTIKEQLIQLIRPFYLTTSWYESFLPLLLGLFITIRLFFLIYKSRYHLALFISGIFIILVGIVFPRSAFLGSWEHGARIILMGFTILFALWSGAENKLRRLIQIWVISTFIINLSVSHYLWNKHTHSQNKALNVMENNFAGAKMRTEIISTDNGPSVPLGGQVAAWAWCKGYIADSFNAVAGFNNFGPVKYIGLNTEDRNSKRALNGVIYYHPYIQLDPRIFTGKETYLIDDEIYTIFRE